MSESVLIIDAMALIQQQHNFSDTFEEFAVSVLRQVVSLAVRHNAKRADFVGDRYELTSIKQHERQNRSSHGETRVHIQTPLQKMPKQIKKFLACGQNKEDLLKLLVDEWKNCSSHLFSGVQIYATYGEDCKKLSIVDDTVVSEDVQALETDHEEADTRMFLHIFHAATCCPEMDIVVRTVDTDVFIIALWISTLISSRLVLLLTSPVNSRLLDMKKISSNLGNEVATALVGLHPFTGYDTVSAFKGKGKIKGLKILLNDAAYMEAFAQLSQNWTVDEHLEKALEKFVCELYGWKGCDSVDDVRYNCFRFGNVGDTSMPPNKDSLHFHILRANYQAPLCRCSVLQHVSAPSPEESGWVLSDSILSVKWRKMEIAPQRVMQCVTCKCKKSSCNSSKCTCRKSNIECTNMCQCSDCTNRHVTDNSDDTDDDSDTEE